MGEQQHRTWKVTIPLSTEMTLGTASSFLTHVRELGAGNLEGSVGEKNLRVVAEIDEMTLAAYQDANVHDFADYDVRVGYDLAMIVSDWGGRLAAVGHSEVTVSRPELVAESVR